jgi:hypothetical protein
MPSDDDLVHLQEPPAPSHGVTPETGPRSRRTPQPPPGRPGQPTDKPVRVAWRQGALTRAEELASLHAWVASSPEAKQSEVLSKAIRVHLAAARDAAMYRRPWFGTSPTGALIERAMSNLDAAEATMINIAPPSYVLGQLPNLLNHVQRHLVPKDPRRQEFEYIAHQFGVQEETRRRRRSAAERPQEGQPADGQPKEVQRALPDEERGRIASAVRGASSAALREQLRVRSFRNVLLATALLMAMLAVGIAVLGLISPTTVPLCFEPERSGQTVVVCPTAQSSLLSTTDESGPAAPDVDDAVKQTAGPWDLLTVELVGLTAAAVGAATAIRGIRGSSEPHNLPVALAALKLPTGAITAFLGLLLMRGQFVPGLSALDTSAQILAWALVFGFAQQLFTRLVDQQAHSVLDSVRGADTRPEPPPP